MPFQALIPNVRGNDFNYIVCIFFYLILVPKLPLQKSEFLRSKYVKILLEGEGNARYKNDYFHIFFKINITGKKKLILIREEEKESRKYYIQESNKIIDNTDIFICF